MAKKKCCAKYEKKGNFCKKCPLLSDKASACELWEQVKAEKKKEERKKDKKEKKKGEKKK